MGFQETANCGIVYNRGRVRGSYSSSMSSSVDEKNVEELRPRAGKSNSDLL